MLASTTSPVSAQEKDNVRLIIQKDVSNNFPVQA